MSFFSVTYLLNDLVNVSQELLARTLMENLFTFYRLWFKIFIKIFNSDT